MSTQTVVNHLRGQFAFAHNWLDGTLGEITSEQAHWQPAGRAQPIAAEYLHVAVSEDMLLAGMVLGSASLALTSFAGKTGASELPPQMPPWSEWAQRVRVDLPAARAYAQAVYAQTDAILSNLKDDVLQQPIDLSAIGIPNATVGFLFDLMLLNVHCHAGEISCVKGLQGLQGYPA